MRPALAGLCLLLAAPTVWADGSAYEKMAAYNSRRNGHAVLVRKGGKIVFEGYQNGWSAAKPHRLASGSKSFWGVVAVAAVEDGWLKLDEKASDTLTEWKGDPRKSRITVRQLLSMTSGLDPGPKLRTPASQDKFGDAVKLGMTGSPGKQFKYGGSHFFSLGELIKRKLAKKKQGPADYLEKRILDRIGMKLDRWLHDYAGNPMLPFGAYATAREWSKFGELLLRGGKWGEKQIVKKSLLDQCFRPSSANASYGLTFWLNPGTRTGVGNRGQPMRAPSSLPRDLFYAAGNGGQKMWIIRSLGIVVLRFGETRGGWNDADFLAPLLRR